VELMALEGFDNVPIWQRLVLMLMVSVIIVGGWYWFFYDDALRAHEAAEGALVKAEADLSAAKKKQENFLEEQRKLAEAEAEIHRKMEVLPMHASTVDNLMQVFQQRARMVGLTVESWTNEAESRQDFHARLPIKIRATGTWSQVGEFFRQVSELKQIVSVEGLALKSTGAAERGASPQLSVEFEAATYRFLSEEERKAATTPSRRDRRTR
jgi:type IV pilus assembly protein PilO